MSDSAYSPDSQDAVETLLRRFEEGWRAGQTPDIDGHLPSEAHARRSALVELVHIDLEYRLRAGEAARVEGYLLRYPELAGDAEAVLDLIDWEWELRRPRQPSLQLDEFLGRFPQHAEMIKCRLQDTSLPRTVIEARVSPPASEGAAAHGARYRPVRFHARGGLGEVHVALDAELDREVALKRIRSPYHDYPESRQRFLREAQLTGRLEHPGVVPVYGLVEEADQPCYAMRFIQGETMSAAIQRYHDAAAADRPKQLRQLLGRFVAMCNTLAYAHSKGVLHRDLKPQNVMLGEYGETIVLDWGLAARQGERGKSESSGAPPRADGSLTSTGQVMGTPGFMAPEQAAGQWQRVGPASDVYSLGATLYCVLTGRAPPADQTAGAGPGRVRADRVNAEVPKALAAVCAKAMVPQPEDRYPTALELAREVERWLADEPVEAFPEPLPARAGRWARKHRTLVATAAAGLLVALVSLSVGLAVVGGLNRDLKTANADLETSNIHLDEARALAEGKRAEAEQERNIAVAVNEFLQEDLLGQADIGNQPAQEGAGGRDRNITVAELLGRAARRIEGKFKDQPQTEASLRRTIGNAYRALGKFDLAQPHLERSVALAEKALGRDALFTLTSKNNLALLYDDQGKYDKAEPLYLQVLEQSKAQLGADHPDTLSCKNNLAALYYAQSKYEKAEPLYLEVLEFRKQRLGDDHPDTLTTKNNLAALYEEQGRYDKAEPLYLETVRQMERTQGADHPNTLQSKNNLGLLYHTLGKYDRAEPLLVEVLRQREKKLGADHPDTLKTKNNLAMLYHARGQFDRAEPMFVELLERRRKALGDDHPSTLTSKHNLAALYDDQKRYDRSEPLYRELIPQREKKLGADHPETLASKHNLAMLYQDQKKYDLAEALQLEVIRLAEAKLGADHPQALADRNNLATLYRDQKKYDRAEALLAEVNRLSQAKLGADHPRTLTSKINLAALYKEQKQFEKAEALYQEVVAAAVNKPGLGSSETQRWVSELPRLYDLWGRPEKAQPLLQQRLDFVKGNAGAESPAAARAMASLGLNLLRQKKHADAEKQLRDCLRVREKAEAELWTTFYTRSLLGEALAGQKKYDDARPMLLQGYEGMNARAAAMPPQSRALNLKEAVQRLVRLYEATGDETEAARWRKKLDEGAKK